MTDLPGYGGGVFCPNCYSISHTTCEGDTMTREQYTGLQRDLFDDLSAILRNYGYDDEKAHTIMETLDDE